MGNDQRTDRKEAKETKELRPHERSGTGRPRSPMNFGGEIASE